MTHYGKEPKTYGACDCNINIMYEAIYKNCKMTHEKMALGEKNCPRL